MLLKRPFSRRPPAIKFGTACRALPSACLCSVVLKQPYKQLQIPQYVVLKTACLRKAACVKHACSRGARAGARSVMTVSFHKYGDFFPGTGALGDVGAGAGARYSVNVPLQEGMDDESYRYVFEPIMQKARGPALKTTCN